MKLQRIYISVYFEDAKSAGKKRGDVTLAFSVGDELLESIKELSSSDIKNIIGIYSYDDLIIAAAQEDRSLGNYIKHRLKVHMENGKKNPAS